MTAARLRTSWRRMSTASSTRHARRDRGASRDVRAPAASSAHAQTVARTRAEGARRAAVAGRAARTSHAHRREHAGPQDLQRQAASLDARWTGRLTAFAAAAMVVLTLGAVLLPVATIRSTALLAAQLALDHLKCFTIEGDADGEPIAKEQAEATLQQEFDLTVTVPPSLAAETSRADGGAPLPLRRRTRRALDVSRRTASPCRCSSSRA